MNYSWLILLLFVHCAHSLSFQFSATQSPGHYGESTISATCDPSRKCALDTSSRSTCERWGCCYLNNECFAKNYFIINQGPSESAKKKVPLFSIATDEGSPVTAHRAEALKYCQDNYQNGKLPIVTATADWLTKAGRTEKFKGLFTGDAVRYGFYLYVDYNYLTDEVTTVDGEFIAKGADFEHEDFWHEDYPLVTMWGDLEISNNTPVKRKILCQHD